MRKRAGVSPRLAAFAVLFLGAIGCSEAASDGDAAAPGGAAGSGGTPSQAGRGGSAGGAPGNAGGGGRMNATGGSSASGGAGAATSTGGASGASGLGGASLGGSGNAGNSGGTSGGSAGRGGTVGNGGRAGSAGSGRGDAGSGGVSAGAGGASAAGGGGSGGSAGQVGLPPGVTALFPGPNDASVCKDPQLRITFPAAPTLGKTGTIEVVASGGSVAASVNLATMTVTDSIGGQSFSLERRAFVDGNTAVIYLPSKGLAYGQTYTVNVPAGAIVPSGGGSFSVSGDSWRFSTLAAAPSSLASLSVALDGGGSFCSLQGALDALPSNNSQASVITLANGNYHEIVYWKSKSNVTVRGESRKGTVILGTNNNNLNPSTKSRALVGADSSSGVVFENLTIHNLTPQGGSQAEALRLEGCTHCVIRDADILSLQDTLLWSGTLYAKNCYIAGNVDFIWGTGAAYFDTCEIKTVGRNGYIVQARNGTSGYGYVFVDSKLTSDAGITGSVLARVDASVYPGSHVAYVNCAIGSHISAAGWLLTGGSAGSSLRFWEYQSTDLDGNPLGGSGRMQGSKQITESEAATMRDPSAVLGGWDPPD